MRTFDVSGNLKTYLKAFWVTLTVLKFPKLHREPVDLGFPLAAFMDVPF